MARKTKRDKDQDIRLSEAQMRHPGMEDTIRSKPDAGVPSSTGETTELEQEYQYVLADLRRIGLIALVMLGALIALALLLP